MHRWTSLIFACMQHNSDSLQLGSHGHLRHSSGVDPSHHGHPVPAVLQESQGARNQAGIIATYKKKLSIFFQIICLFSAYHKTPPHHLVK